MRRLPAAYWIGEVQWTGDAQGDLQIISLTTTTLKLQTASIASSALPSVLVNPLGNVGLFNTFLFQRKPTLPTFM